MVNRNSLIRANRLSWRESPSWEGIDFLEEKYLDGKGKGSVFVERNSLRRVDRFSARVRGLFSVRVLR